MSEQAPTSVPKFASFRPKPKPTPSTSSNADVNPKDHKRSREEHGSQRQDERKHHRRHRHKSPSREQRQELEVIHKVKEHSPQARDDEAVEIFVIDRKGDLNNLTYGSVHRYSVPPFHRVGAGGVIGASRDTKIDRDYGDEKGIILTNRKEDKPSSREKYVFSKAENEKPRFLKVRPDLIAEAAGNHDADYIPLQLPRGKKRKRCGSGSGTSSDSEQDRNHYRSIHGKAKSANKPSDEYLEYATETDSSGSEAGRTVRHNTAIKQTTIELSRKVDQSPGDIDAWLALIEHQDTLLHAGDDRRRVTSAEIKSTADIKIYMYEKALANCKTLNGRERLLLGLMSEGAKIWDLKTQSNRWEVISRDNIDSLLLWTSYVNFKQSTFSNFRYEEIRNVFLQRIQLLSTAMSKADLEKAESLCLQLVYIVLRFTLFARESGYSELAMAVWQGLLELNFCAPPQTISWEESIGSFQEFWESEIPRIGEGGALGWRQYAANEDDSTVPEAQTDEVESSEDLSVDVFRSWAAAERMRTLASRRPARTLDEVTEDDPFRVILFSDIEPFMILMPPSSQYMRKSLVDALFLFCRLPPIVGLHHEKPTNWLGDAFIRGELLDYDTAWIKCHCFDLRMFEPEQEHIDNKIVSILRPSVHEFSISSDTLFYPGWFNRMVPWYESYPGDNGPLPYEWVRNTLKQLIQLDFTEDLAEYYLAFEWRNEPDTVKKAAKSLLKQHPSCLRLYNAYAIVEWSKGNKDVATGVFSAALSINTSMPGYESRDAILLWKSWTWASLEDSNNESALTHLISIPDGRPNNNNTEVSPSVLLRTRQHLLSNHDYLLSSGHAKHSVVFVECLALLEYLTSSSSDEPQSSSQGDIAAALLVYTDGSQKLMSRNLSNSTAHELLLQSATRLLFHHARVGPFRPALFRDQLSHFLSFFPQNTIFLSMYTWNESRLRIDARVRSLLVSTTLTPQNDTLSSRLFAIRYEIATGTIHSARSAFEHAVSSPACRFSAGLWRFYVLWSSWIVKTGKSKEKQKAKEVWYRAIRTCPWAKQLYMLGMTVLNEQNFMEDRELKEIGKILGEKELRVHIDLEERQEEWDLGHRSVAARRRG